jgi:hypothetical protein
MGFTPCCRVVAAKQGHRSCEVQFDQDGKAGEYVNLGCCTSVVGRGGNETRLRGENVRIQEEP